MAIGGEDVLGLSNAVFFSTIRACALMLIIYQRQWSLAHAFDWLLFCSGARLVAGFCSRGSHTVNYRFSLVCARQGEVDRGGS